MAIDIVNGTGYRIGTTDRIISGIAQPTAAPNGFVVVNTTNGNVFIVAGGVWIGAGSFPNIVFTQPLYDDWLLS